MSGELWTAEDVATVARAGYTGNWDNLDSALRDSSLERARRVLAALADAGRLRPADAEKRTEWGWSHGEPGDRTYGPMPEADAREPRTGAVMRRETLSWVGPWQPVQDTEEKPNG